jgi:O-antigen/teichoic acid export membrane protein
MGAARGEVAGAAPATCVDAPSNTIPTRTTAPSRTNADTAEADGRAAVTDTLVGSLLLLDNEVSAPSGPPVASDSAPRRLVLRGLGWSSIGYLASVGLIFFGQVFAARLLSRDDFGTYSLAVSIFSTVALIMQLGLPHSMLRRASAALTNHHSGTARNEIVSAFVLATAAAVVVSVVIASPIGEEVLDALFSRTGVAGIAALIGVRTGLRIFENLAPEALRAFRDFLRVSLFDGFLANLLLVAVLGVMLVGDGNASVSDVMLVSVLTAALALVPALWSIHQKLRRMEHEPLRIHNPLEPAMWLSTVGRALLAQLDLLVVGVLGTSAQVATYAVPFRLALFVGFPLILVNQVVPPLIASWHAGRAIDRLQRTLRATAGLAFLLAVAITLVYLVAGRTIISELFGAKYVDGFTVLIILSVGQIVQTYAGSCGFALMMTGHQRVYAWILSISTILTVALDVAFWELWGIEGVAVATAVSLSVQNFVQAAALQRLTGFTSLADLRLTLAEGAGTVRRWRGKPAPRD